MSEKSHVAVEQCFFCLKGAGVIMDKYLRNVLPRAVCLGPQSICSKCSDLMGQGVILISCLDEGEHRKRECRDCKHKWFSPREMANATPNISGEKTEQCPKCNSRAVNSGPVITSDKQNPYRTGGWVVVRSEFIERIINPEELRKSILKNRFAFVPDNAWDIIGLPRGEVKEKEEPSV